MIYQFFYPNIIIGALIFLLIFIIIISVAVITFQKELEPNCNKGFSIILIIYLILVMFSVIVGFLGFESNNSFAHILLSFSLEFYLFHKKSNWKFSTQATILLSISIILKISNIVLAIFTYGYDYYIASVVLTILISISNIILGIVILKFLGKTTEENQSLQIYTKPISIGVVFIFIIKSIITPISSISFLIFISIENYDYYMIFYWVSNVLYGISLLIFLIGLIYLSMGAIKTMSVPLIFSKDKRVKPIQPISTNFCPECGVPLQAGAKFCMNCGRSI